MWQRLALVVDSDPTGRVAPTAAGRRPQWLIGEERLRVGDKAQSELFVRDDGSGPARCIVMPKTRGPELHLDAGRVTVNGAPLVTPRTLEQGDVIGLGDVVVRVVAADIIVRGAVYREGSYWRLPRLRRGHERFVVTGPAGADERRLALAVVGTRRHAWLDRLVARGGSAAALPVCLEVTVFPERIGATRVFDVAPGVELADLKERGAPLPLSLALRIGLDLCDGVIAAWDGGALLARLDAQVGFDGRTRLLPGSAPWFDPGGRVDLDDEQQRDAVEASLLFDAVAGLLEDRGQPFAPLFSLIDASPPSPWRIRDRLRELARETAPAGDDEVKAVVRGLFADEFRAVCALAEELAVLDDAALDALDPSAAGEP